MAYCERHDGLCVPICTFCKVPNIEWTFPVRSFVVTIEVQNLIGKEKISDCFSCTRCHDAIKKGDMESLIDFTLEGFELGLLAQELPPLDPQQVEYCRESARKHHQQFLDNITGDALPIS